MQFKLETVMKKSNQQRTAELYEFINPGKFKHKIAVIKITDIIDIQAMPAIKKLNSIEAIIRNI